MSKTKLSRKKSSSNQNVYKLPWNTNVQNYRTTSKSHLSSTQATHFVIRSTLIAMPLAEWTAHIARQYNHKWSFGEIPKISNISDRTSIYAGAFIHCYRSLCSNLYFLQHMWKVKWNYKLIVWLIKLYRTSYSNCSEI